MSNIMSENSYSHCIPMDDVKIKCSILKIVQTTLILLELTKNLKQKSYDERKIL